MYVVVIDREIYGPFPSFASAKAWLDRVADDDDWIAETHLPSPATWTIVELITPDGFEASDFDDFMRDAQEDD